MLYCSKLRYRKIYYSILYNTKIHYITLNWFWLNYLCQSIAKNCITIKEAKLRRNINPIGSMRIYS